MSVHKNKTPLLAKISLFVLVLGFSFGVLSSVPGVSTVYAQNFSAKCDPPGGAALDENNCGIVAYVQAAINILTALVGVVVVIMVAVGGVQYTTSRDNPQETAAAKRRIYNAILALLVYLFTFAFLQYLVPGGVF